jgi:hypothetical protein
LAACEFDKLNAPRERELVEQIAKKISQESEEVFTTRFRLDRYSGSEQEGTNKAVKS